MNTSDHVAIVTHEHLPGAPHILRDYLNKRHLARVSFISHPLLNRNGSSYHQLFKLGIRVKEKTILRSWALPMISYPMDTILTLIWLLGQPTIDWYIGVGPLNAIAGILLKMLGKVRRVVFYSIDFVPKRFVNPVLNSLYHTIEKWSVRQADVCWDVSPRIQEGRVKFLRVKSYERLVVPIGVEKRNIAKENATRKAYRLGFVGHLLEKQGVQLILQALPIIAKKFPRVELFIIGGGEYKNALEALTMKFDETKRVTFTDWISDQQEVARLLSTCVMGLAPYVPEGENETNFTYFADPTKIKTYLAAGLPVILTDVPYNAGELEKKSCAMVIPYDEDAVFRVVSRLFSDRKKLEAMRRAALTYARGLSWDIVFRKATGI